MGTAQTSAPHLTLHVFKQEGGWHWGIAIPRVAGSGFKVLAYSEVTFTHEADARRDGNRALDTLVEHQSLECG
ncbi:hypothetical protein [Paraburkholderia sp. SIMBA_053]|uniref:hypothetical protein n=1 Tax=Paraburkholderia sp. SIMBA_053 TaxID=3085794 RepID=UPI00397CB149